MALPLLALGETIAEAILVHYLTDQIVGKWLGLPKTAKWINRVALWIHIAKFAISLFVKEEVSKELQKTLTTSKKTRVRARFVHDLRKLENLRREHPRAIEAAQERAAEAMVDDVRAQAPQKSGAFRRSIGVRHKHYSGKSVSYIGPRSGYTEQTTGGKVIRPNRYAAILAKQGKFSTGSIKGRFLEKVANEVAIEIERGLQ